MLKKYTKIEVYENGNKLYLNDEGKFHRLDGPAIEYPNGSKEWYINGKEHRNIDPAVDFFSGTKLWRFKGERHRVGGSYISFDKLWFIDGEGYSKEGYYNKVWDI